MPKVIVIEDEAIFRDLVHLESFWDEELVGIPRIVGALTAGNGPESPPQYGWDHHRAPP